MYCKLIEIPEGHTNRVMDTKVKLEVGDMKYHFESTEEIREIRTEVIYRNTLLNFQKSQKRSYGPF